MGRIRMRLRGFARRSVGLLLGTLLLTAPAVVFASHQFPDVPTGHQFHNEISAIAKAGITAGFADGGYHPSEPVTRQSMAAFMHRGFGRAAFSAGQPFSSPYVSVAAGSVGSAAVAVRGITITVPGANNAFSPNQLVHVTGRITLEGAMGPAAGCPCEFYAQLEYGLGGYWLAAQYQTFASPSDDVYYWSFDVEALAVALPGPVTFVLRVRLSNRDISTNAATFSVYETTSLSAQTFPFGPTGGNVPRAPGADNVVPDDARLPERRREE